MRDDQKKRRLRGWMLKLLQKEYPNAVEESALVLQLRAVLEGASDRDIAVEAAYLHEKGYLVREERTVMDEKIVMLRITARGIDLVQGAGPSDPAVATALVG